MGRRGLEPWRPSGLLLQGTLWSSSYFRGFFLIFGVLIMIRLIVNTRNSFESRQPSILITLLVSPHVRAR